MPYQEHFKLADDMIAHLDSVVVTIRDPFISSRYVGFVAVAAVTVYELAIKSIFIDFGTKKHKVLGTYTYNQFDRINGKVRLSNIRGDYIKPFGKKYLQRFDKKFDKLQRDTLRVEHISIKDGYNNIITWRNDFAHEGQAPKSATYEDVTNAYRTGKRLITCLSETMQR